jgi:hypothetical protein
MKNMILRIINTNARLQISTDECEGHISYPEKPSIKLYKVSLVSKYSVRLVEIEASQVFSDSVTQ